MTNKQITRLFLLVDKAQDNLDEIHRLLLDLLEEVHANDEKGTK